MRARPFQSGGRNTVSKLSIRSPRYRAHHAGARASPLLAPDVRRQLSAAPWAEIDNPDQPVPPPNSARCDAESIFRLSGRTSGRCIFSPPSRFFFLAATSPPAGLCRDRGVRGGIARMKSAFALALARKRRDILSSRCSGRVCISRSSRGAQAPRWRVGCGALFASFAPGLPPPVCDDWLRTLCCGIVGPGLLAPGLRAVKVDPMVALRSNEPSPPRNFRSKLRPQTTTTTHALATPLPTHPKAPPSQHVSNFRFVAPLARQVDSFHRRRASDARHRHLREHRGVSRFSTLFSSARRPPFERPKGTRLAPHDRRALAGLDAGCPYRTYGFPRADRGLHTGLRVPHMFIPGRATTMAASPWTSTSSESEVLDNSATATCSGSPGTLGERGLALPRCTPRVRLASRRRLRTLQPACGPARSPTVSQLQATTR